MLNHWNKCMRELGFIAVSGGAGVSFNCATQKSDSVEGINVETNAGALSAQCGLLARSGSSGCRPAGLPTRLAA
jgi:hypothetical protein